MFTTSGRNHAYEASGSQDFAHDRASSPRAVSGIAMQTDINELGILHYSDIEYDVDALLSSLELQKVRRYMDQLHWQKESAAAHAADCVEPGLKLENVAAHSWHVADAVMLLAPLFPDVNPAHAVELAIVHDKLELFTGDIDPVGPDGQGNSSHAFDPMARAEKTRLELEALDRYLNQLRGPVRERQRDLILETIYGYTSEARLVKAVDKLQALAFVVVKKGGDMTDDHLSFSLRYSFKAVEYFPGVAGHYAILISRLITAVAKQRNVAVSELLNRFPAAAEALVGGRQS